MSVAVVIPARYASSRFPGKPLALIAGQSMLSRVCDIAREAARGMDGARFVVATDDERIQRHAEELDVEVIMTPESCATGTDRVHAAVTQMQEKPRVVINLQGDAPLTPASFVRAVIRTLESDTNLEVVTPVVALSWDALDGLRKQKETSPFSGTTAIVNEEGDALWFSKNIVPGMRKEASLRESSPISPVWRHVGIYGYRADVLARLVKMPQSHYEKLEGLEQLRMLENGIRIRTVQVDPGELPTMSGIDTPEDVPRAEKLLADYDVRRTEVRP